jgi:hypothetical protein
MCAGKIRNVTRNKEDVVSDDPHTRDPHFRKLYNQLGIRSATSMFLYKQPPYYICLAVGAEIFQLSFDVGTLDLDTFANSS